MCRTLWIRPESRLSYCNQSFPEWDPSALSITSSLYCSLYPHHSFRISWSRALNRCRTTLSIDILAGEILYSESLVERLCIPYLKRGSSLHVCRCGRGPTESSSTRSESNLPDKSLRIRQIRHEMHSPWFSHKCSLWVSRSNASRISFWRGAASCSEIIFCHCRGIRSGHCSRVS